MGKSILVSFFKTYFSNKVFRNTLIYILASGFNAAIPFFILPVLTAYLTPQEYGVVATFMVFNSIFLIAIGVEQYNYVSVNFYSKTPEDIRIYVSNIIMVSFLIFVFFLIISISLSSYFLTIGGVSIQWIVLSVIVAFFQFLSQLGLTLWQLKNEAVRYGLYQVLHSLVNYTLSIFLIAHFGLGESGRILGIMLAAVLFGSYSIFYIAKQKLIAWNFSFKDIKSSLVYSLPLVPHAFAGWINTASDRLILNHYSGVSETGIYAIYYQIAMVISLVASSFNRAFIPYIFKTLTQGGEEGKRKLVRYTYYYFGALLTLSLFLAFATPAILKLLVNEEYHQSERIIYWVIAGFTADGLYFGVINYLFYSKKTAQVSYITFSSCVIHLVASFLLVPKVGMAGAAYSTAISYIFTFVVAWIVSNRLFPMPWFRTANIK